MFSISYYKYLVKSNIKFLFAFTFVLCVFLVVMSNVFTPDTVNGMEQAVKGTFVQNIISSNGTLIGFMSNSFYALMAIIFPMVYSIMVGNRMIAEKVDKGSMAGFLSTTTSRLQIVITSMAYFVISLFFMWGVASIVGIIAADYFQPDALDIEKFLMLNLGALLYHIVISSVCFCSSCIFNTSKKSLTFGAGIPLISFVVSLFIKLSSDLEFLKYFTFNTLFNTGDILKGNGYIEEFIVMAVISLMLYIIGIIVFDKKDLPL